MSDSFKVVSLHGIDLADKSTLRRKHVRPPNRRSETYIEKYDSTTLFYDCFYNPAKRCYTFTAPRLLNLWPAFKSYLCVDNAPFKGRISRSTWQRCEQINVYAREGAHLSFAGKQLNTGVTVRPTQRSMFGGLNTALAMNKNNQLSWIKDWATFHINAHGLEGVCIIDNESTQYRPEQLLDELKSLNGLKAACVISAPFTYGPADGSKKLEVSPRFLQSSMFNLVKQDMFADARAVLSVDIDELVIPRSSKNVFDAAISSRLGTISFREQKVFPNSDSEQAHSHRDHTYKQEHAKLGNTKWCVSGSGFMNRFSWAVHRFGGGFFLLTETEDFKYLHCQATTTNWKKNRYRKVGNLTECTEAKNALKKYLDERG